MARSAVLRGPAIIQFQSQTFYSQGDIAVALNQTTFGIESAMFGQVDVRKNEISHTLSFVPVGKWAALSVLFPYATALIGSSVFGADKPLTIWTRDGKKRVYKAAAVTQMPSIEMGSTKTLFGPVQFTCIHAEESDWSAANSLYTDSDEAYPGDVSFSAADIKVQPYTCAYGGASPWTSFRTKEGVSVTNALTLAPETNDHKGLFDMTFQSLVMSAVLQPEGVTPANVLALLKHQGADAVRGASIGAGAPNLDISGTGVFVRLNAAAVVQANEAYGAMARRVGQMTFQATRTITAGVADPLFYVGTENPDEEP